MLSQNENLIQKSQGVSSSEYEGGTDHNPYGKHKHSKSQSKGKRSLIIFLVVASGSIQYAPPPNQSFTSDEKIKWNDMMKFFKKNPQSLLEMNTENPNISMPNVRTHRKSTSKRGQ